MMLRDGLQAEIRNILRVHEDGLRATEIASMLGKYRQAVHRCLARMPDAYIDRWEPCNNRHEYAAVWCVVPVPENCPKPKKHANR